jgi:hypothetical protein
LSCAKCINKVRQSGIFLANHICIVTLESLNGYAQISQSVLPPSGPLLDEN